MFLQPLIISCERYDFVTGNSLSSGVSNFVKDDIFGLDITDVGGSIRLFSDVMKRLGIKLDEDEL